MSTNPRVEERGGRDEVGGELRDGVGVSRESTETVIVELIPVSP